MPKGLAVPKGELAGVGCKLGVEFGVADVGDDGVPGTVGLRVGWGDKDFGTDVGNGVGGVEGEPGTTVVWGIVVCCGIAPGTAVGCDVAPGIVAGCGVASGTCIGCGADGVEGVPGPTVGCVVWKIGSVDGLGRLPGIIVGSGVRIC